MCPVKWNHARAAALLALFSQYRPRSIRISYVSTCATVDSGAVSVGTVWAGDRFFSSDSDAEYSAALVQTSGGFSTVVYRNRSSIVRCGTQLRYNLYPTSQISEDEIPFTILVHVRSSLQSVQIGKLVISGDIQMVGPTRTGIAPATYSGTIEFHKDQQNNETYFTLSEDDLSTKSPGTDYKFQAAAPYKDSNDNFVFRRLSTFTARLASITNGLAKFTVDNAIPAGRMLTNLIGLTSNF